VSLPPEHRSGIIAELWRHPLGRITMVAVTITVLMWALRESAFLTRPIIDALAAVLTPLAVGFTIAYVLCPAVDLLQRWGVPRLIGTVLLFLAFTVSTVAAVAWVVPAVTRQGADLAMRSFSDIHFHDRDGNGQLDPGEPYLRADPDRAWWFDDRNGDGRRGIDERSWPDGHPSIAIEASLLNQMTSWSKEHTRQLRRFLGLELDRSQLFELEFYRRESADFYEALDIGLAQAKEGSPSETWPALLRLTQVQPGVAPAPLSWPGVDEVEVRQAAEALSEEDRSLWLQRVQEVLNRLEVRHQDLLATIRQGRDGNATGPLGERFSQLRQSEESIDDVAEIDAFLERLQAGERSGDAMAMGALGLIRGGGSGSSSLVRGLATQLEAEVGRELSGLPASAGTWARGALGNIPALFGLALDLVLIPIYAFFLVLSMPRLRLTVKGLVPTPGRERTLRILHGIERVVSAFFRGRLIVCVLCAILCYLGFLPLGVPYAALFALLIGLATAIPLAGFFFLIPALLLTLLEGGEHLALRIGLIIAVYSVVQTLEATVFTPTIMGKEVELHPVLLIVALIFFGRVFGFVGLLLAVPMAATLRILVRELGPALRKKTPDGGADPLAVEPPDPAPPTT
jgi:predicted PurR-regulated permease PerM